MTAINLCTQIDALQAKIAAFMLHPRRHPWKQAMHAAICTSSPSHLGITLPIFSAAPLLRRAAAPHLALYRRHVSYISTMRCSAPFRVMPSDDMPLRAILCEPLFDNTCVHVPVIS